MRFIVHLIIEPTTTREEIAELLPAEQERVSELLEQDILETFYLSHSMREVWGIFTGDSFETVRIAVESLPFFKFMKAEYTELAEAQS